MPKLRPQKQLQPKRTLRIYCEGQKTEPNYLLGYLNLRYPGDRSKAVVKIEPTSKNTPKQLVEEAVKAKKSANCLPGDEFWVVYDREGVAKYSHELHHQARQLAQKNGIKIALSNICFELWILLHVKRTTAQYACCTDLIKSDAFKEALGALGIASYEKGQHDLFRRLERRISDARKNAKAIREQALGAAADGDKNHPHRINPYTDIDLLLDAIDAFQSSLMV